jgi:hypothetical protein
VAAQIALLTAIFLSALVGLGWPSPLEPPAYVIGGLFVAAGIVMLAAGGERARAGLRCDAVPGTAETAACGPPASTGLSAIPCTAAES